MPRVQRGAVGRWAAVLGAGVVVATGCSAPGSTAERSPVVAVMTAGAALHAPVWSYREGTLVGLTDDGRVAEISNVLSGHATARFSPRLEPGRNLQISRKNEQHVFVPQPIRNRVAVLDLVSLRTVEEFDAGPAPAYLSEDGGMRVLLALSADGSAVTPIDEYGFRKLPTAHVTGDPADVIDGSNRGRNIAYHITGHSGVRYYQGHSSPPDVHGSMDMNVSVSAGDGTATTRSYVARAGDDTVYAIDARRGGEGLTVLASTRLRSPIRQLGSDDTRLYAATDQDLTVLQTEDVTGFPQRTIPVLHITNYRSGLPANERSAPLTGMAVGPHRVYLTFAGTPLVVSVTKPNL